MTAQPLRHRVEVITPSRVVVRATLRGWRVEALEVDSRGPIARRPGWWVKVEPIKAV